MDPASTLENPIVVAGLLTQAVGAGVLAVLLQRFHRQLGRGYLRDWALAWVAIAIAFAGGAWSVLVMSDLPAYHWSRLLTTVT